MECIEARALKSSFLKEIGMTISTQQVCFDDVRCLAGGVTCDDFSVDDLFDFSDKYFDEDGSSSQESEEDEIKDSFNSMSSQHRSFDSSTLEKEFEPLPERELAVPVDDMENLEWLSQIVDDSRTEISLLCPIGNFKAKTGSFLENRSEPVEAQRISVPCFPLPGCRKPRGKRARRNGRVAWSYGSTSLTPESSSSMSYSSNGSSVISPFVFVDSAEESELFSSVEKPLAKKQKKKPSGETGYLGFGGSQTLRRCSHCQVQKTPQWRTGPMGPKTLCNACGVRYKSGRLFPEYRPACSPTFSQEIHSNSHRKVLEIRLKKDTDEPIVSGLTSIVPSF